MRLRGCSRRNATWISRRASRPGSGRPSSSRSSIDLACDTSPSRWPILCRSSTSCRITSGTCFERGARRLVVRSGIIHVHSTLSYDGEHSLAELASFGRKCGYSFIGMTEHSDTFDDAKMKALVEECRRLSDGEFLLIAGIEFSCEGNLHLIGLGIRQFTSASDPIVVARFIRAQGGLAIVSHPSRSGYEIPPGLVGEINGIEVWNASNDSRFVPDRRCIELWRGFRAPNQTLPAAPWPGLHPTTRPG